MSIQTLPADFLLRKHNTELYLMKLIEPKLYFLDVMPTANSDTGEFPTVLKEPTAAEDTANGVMSEPLDTSELSELTEIEISPLNAVLGKTSAVGYKFKYSQKFLNRSDSDARVQNAFSKIAAGMAQKINVLLAQDIVTAASVALPAGLSAWSTAIDPRKDAISMRHQFSPADSPFTLTDAYINDTLYKELETYYMSMEWPFNSDAIDVDGTIFHNVKNSFAGMSDNFLGLDSNIPAGIVETYVDPDFSTIQSSILQDPQKAINLPPALINVNQYREQEAPHNNVFEIWAEIGYSNQEPKGAMAGTLS